MLCWQHGFFSLVYCHVIGPKDPRGIVPINDLIRSVLDPISRSELADSQSRYIEKETPKNSALLDNVTFLYLTSHSDLLISRAYLVEMGYYVAISWHRNNLVYTTF